MSFRIKNENKDTSLRGTKQSLHKQINELVISWGNVSRKHLHY